METNHNARLLQFSSKVTWGYSNTEIKLKHINLFIIYNFKLKPYIVSFNNKDKNLLLGPSFRQIVIHLVK